MGVALKDVLPALHRLLKRAQEQLESHRCEIGFTRPGGDAVRAAGSAAYAARCEGYVDGLETALRELAGDSGAPPPDGLNKSWETRARQPSPLPHGTARSVKLALDIAIAALEGKSFGPHPVGRPRIARKLRNARTVLLREKVIWP